MTHRCIRWTCILLMMAIASGCGSKKPVMHGVITLDGEKLDSGTIEFFPVDGEAQTAGTTIGKDGSYRVEVPAVKMKVVIHSSKGVGKQRMYPNKPDSPEVDVR